MDHKKLIGAVIGAGVMGYHGVSVMQSAETKAQTAMIIRQAEPIDRYIKKPTAEGKK